MVIYGGSHDNGTRLGDIWMLDKTNLGMDLIRAASDSDPTLENIVFLSAVFSIVFLVLCVLLHSKVPMTVDTERALAIPSVSGA